MPQAPFIPFGNVASNVNTFMQGQAALPFLQNLPDYANMVGKRSQITSQRLAGEVPDDVVNQLIQTAAERGIAGGFGAGSANTNAALLRALGTTSLQIQDSGSNMLSQSIADTPQAEIWNPMSLYVPYYLGQQEQQAFQTAQDRAESERLNMERSAAWNAQPTTRHYYTSWR